MKTIIKAIARKIMPAAFILAVVFLLAPVSAQAAKKPGKVTKLEEVKATNTSITVKFKKVKGAKKYQVRVYETKWDRYTKKFKTTKKLIKKLETKNTTCTIKGLEETYWYYIKVRAYNGKSYGKWATVTTSTTIDGVKYPGKTTATGKNLEKQYKKFKAMFVEKESPLDMVSYIECTKEVRGDIANYASGSKEDLLRTYKNGYGSDLEIYQVMADVCKKAGIKCAIKKRKSDNPFYVFLIWEGEKIMLFELAEGGSRVIMTFSPNDMERFE